MLKCSTLQTDRLFTFGQESLHQYTSVEKHVRRQGALKLDMSTLFNNSISLNISSIDVTSI